MHGTRAPRAIAGLLVLLVAVAAWGVAPATGATTSPEALTGECPTIMPLDQISTGMGGTAVSVTRGRTLSTFNAEVLGVLRDAVGPGRHIIIADLSGPVVDAAGGLWAGASGSPVFFRDPSTGRDELAGAIAYGLAGGGSTLAGLTPAEDMQALLEDGGGAAFFDSREIAVPNGLAMKMSEATGLSVAETGTITRLRTPLSASGLTDRGLRHMQRAIDRQGLPFIAYMGSSASSTPTTPPGRLRAGDSFAGAMSLGDVTVAGIGTTTFVCDGQAVAFGHPFNWTGETTMAARAADTITIVEDPIFGSYKLANIAENVGTLTQDRLAGIVAELGDGPVGNPITSTVTDLDTGRTRSGESEAVMPDFLPFLSFSHLFQNIDVTIDRIGPGSSEIDYTIRGTRDGGRTWALTRSTSYVSAFDISFDSVLEPSFTAEVLQAFEDEDIEVTSLEVPTLDIKSAVESYRIRSLLVWKGDRYVSREFIRGRPGKLIRLRVVLKPTHRSGTRTVDLTLRVPDDARRSGYIEVVGGGSTFADIPCFIFEEECGEESAGSFDKLLASFRNQPSGDALVARLHLGAAERVRAEKTKTQDAVVTGQRFLGFDLIRN
jgi:hypothetical protein